MIRHASQLRASVHNTPVRGLQLATGEHQVRLVNEALNMSKSFRLTIRPGQTVTRVEMLGDDDRVLP
jgi:hypothetical protein